MVRALNGHKHIYMHVDRELIIVCEPREQDCRLYKGQSESLLCDLSIAVQNRGLLGGVEQPRV
jgi:hypothetical protein